MSYLVKQSDGEQLNLNSLDNLFFYQINVGYQIVLSLRSRFFYLYRSSSDLM